MEVMQPASSQISLWMRCKICPQLSPQFSILLWQVFNIYPHRELGWGGQDSEGLTLLPCLCFLLKHRVTMLSMRVSKMAVQEMIPAFLRMRHSFFFLNLFRTYSYSSAQLKLLYAHEIFPTTFMLKKWPLCELVVFRDSTVNIFVHTHPNLVYLGIWC